MCLDKKVKTQQQQNKKANIKILDGHVKIDVYYPEFDFISYFAI